MKTKVILMLIVSFLAGCATPQNTTKKFFAQESAIARSCLAPTAQMTAEQRFTVDPATHKSAMTTFVDCYSNQVLTVANMMQYDRIDIVYAYLGYLDRLTSAIDQGRIDTPTALASFRQTSKLFNQSIAVADTQQASQASQSRRDFADRLAAFATVVAAADRQRAATAAATRPMLCTSTGVYTQSTVICQ